MKMLRFFFSIAFVALLLIYNTSVFGQFASSVGTPGSTAIYKDSSVFVNWANSCVVERGPMDISSPGAGLASAGSESDAVGPANGSSIVSLGDGGSAILRFPSPIMNGIGPDFAVFENSFSDSFLELAFVEVSSDGTNFFRFPATSLAQDTAQFGPFSSLGDATKLNNLAGKYRGSYGVPFDLQELDGTPGLNITQITHVKIIDVVGSINPLYATYDQFGTAINDPFPTPFASSGFDLDAVGVIHENSTNADVSSLDEAVPYILAPNPAQTYFTVHALNTEIEKILVYSATGTLMMSSTEPTLFISDLPSGVYIVQVQSRKGHFLSRVVKN